MAETGPSRRDAPTGMSTARRSLSPLRQRPPSRAATVAEMSSPPPSRSLRRKSSLLTVDSLRSSTDDILRPDITRNTAITQSTEHSHLHSAPLLLALLPAVGGLLFHNGGAVLTDVTLLVLAAIFLNWSVRLPWDWYHSAQSIRVHDSASSDDYFGPQEDTIIEEGSDSEGHAVAPGAPSPMLRPTSPERSGPKTNSKSDSKSNAKHPGRTAAQSDAAAELLWHELLALAGCFIFPLLGALLLHGIRNQLSRPSEGLVSNYNLTIFVLGAEVRPLSHLIKLVQARTLHLQRIVSENNSIVPKIDGSAVKDLQSRLDELEAHVVSNAVKSPANGTGPKSATTKPEQALITEVKKTLQPDVDALNRAVRRYEKRATLSAMQTEARLQDLEKRMADAITLAAAAERGVSKNRKGSAGVLLDWMCAILVVPVQTAVPIVVWPWKVLARSLELIKSWIPGAAGRRDRGEGRSDGVKRANGRREPGRGAKKAA